MSREVEAVSVNRDNSRLSISTARRSHGKRLDLRTLLPSTIPRLRPAVAGDAPLLSAWECDEHGNGAPASNVFVIESASRPVGCLTLHRRGRSASISHLFVVPAMRRKRIGSHAIRLAVAYAMDIGMAEIQVHLQRTNSAALLAFTACGFTREREVRGQSSIRLRRQVQPFEPICDAGFSYRGLTGENIIRDHQALIDAAARGLSEIPDVQLVLALGSAGRGFADRYSDVDLFVIGRGKSLWQIDPGERWIDGVDFDVFVFDLDEAPYETWNNDRRQALSEGVIAWARNRAGIGELRRAIRLRRREQRSMIAERLLQLTWIGFHPPSLTGTKRFGYYWSLPYDLWLQRGHLRSAHLTIDQASGFLLQLLFLLNGRLIPSAKWRRYLVSRLPALPSQFEERLTSIESAARDHKAFEERATTLLELIEDVFALLLDADLVPRNVYRTYLSTTRDYSSHYADS